MSAMRPWRLEPNATPLRAWRDQDLARVAGRIEAALQEWAHDWGVPLDAARPVRCAASLRQVSALVSWQCLGMRADGGAWIRRAEGEGERLAQAWFDAGCTTPVVAAVVQACQDDVLRCIASAFQLGADEIRDATPPPSIWSPWSGSVLASLPWGGQLLLEVGLVRRLLQGPGGGDPAPVPVRRTALAPVTGAITALPLTLGVCIQGCDLALGELQGLQPGDVLRLQHPIDAPAEVSAAGGTVLCRGWLARSRGRKAVEFAPMGSHGVLTG